jgi:hypothetical protein
LNANGSEVLNLKSTAMEYRQQRLQESTGSVVIITEVKKISIPDG